MRPIDRWIPQLPPGLRWSHNAYYQAWLLRHLPRRIDSALDVGTGRGALARDLAERAGHVDAIDASALMVHEAAATRSTVNWIHGDVLDELVPLRTNGYGVVTAVSSLHHMPLRPALHRLAGLVRPGGLLAVIGHYKTATPADYSMDAMALPANALVGAVRAAQGKGGKFETGMPMLDPTETLREITAAATEILPGSQVTRRLFFRYSLLWRKPTR